MQNNTAMIRGAASLAALLALASLAAPVPATRPSCLEGSGTRYYHLQHRRSHRVNIS